MENSALMLHCRFTYSTGAGFVVVQTDHIFLQIAQFGGYIEHLSQSESIGNKLLRHTPSLKTLLTNEKQHVVPVRTTSR